MESAHYLPQDVMQQLFFCLLFQQVKNKQYILISVYFWH